VKPRPYLRFSAAQGGASTLTLGMNNPTTASSEAPGHSGRLANDGTSATFWQAKVGDTNAWLQIDLERIVIAGKTKLIFPTEGNWRYKVEISDDGETNWKLITDQTQSAGTTKERIDVVQSNPPTGRFLRVTITGAPEGQAPAIAEVELTGTLN
jgi:hypothetical protein